MRNLNEYNQENFQESFSRHTIAQAIARDFDMVVWDKHFDENNIPFEFIYNILNQFVIFILKDIFNYI